MQSAIDKLHDRVINIAEQTAVDALENCDVDHDRVFIKDTLRSALNGLLVSTIAESSGVETSFEDATVQVVAAPKSIALIASAVAKDIKAMTPIARYAAKNVKWEVKNQ